MIAVDLQHDAHLMQQDLLSFNVSEENSENGDSLPWHARLKERLGSITTRRAVTAPTATEIMTTSIQVLENRLKRNRMAGDPPDILIQPVCPQISTLDFHRARCHCGRTTGSGKENGRTFAVGTHQHLTRIFIYT